jgi:group II intron reverse transcriptase/maturase
MQTLLEQALSLDTLRLAWNEVDENRGAGGVDGVSLKAWRRNWEERLVNLAAAVRCNTYKPLKLRLRKIPKQDRRETRTLRIPSISDRVLQRAVLEVLYPIFEPRFLDCSYGYRPRRGLREAVQRVIVLRENGYRYVLDADIDAFFDNVDHDLLLTFLQNDLPDNSLLPLISCWLKLGRSTKDRAVGIPLGSPLSPLWANVTLHRLDRAMMHAGRDMARYADDFLVFADTERQLECVQSEVETALMHLHLQLEPAKTQKTSFEEGFTFLGVHFIGDEYSYTFLNKEIKVEGDEVDFLFRRYGPEYE